MERIPIEKIEEIKDIKREIDDPRIEEKRIQLIKNSYRKIDQYRVSVPLKYLKIAKLDEKIQ